eukprot:16440591-Heterocapsa_arctica.AAC.1
MIKKEANQKYARNEEYKWLDEIHAKLTASRPERQEQRGWRPVTRGGATADRVDRGQLSAQTP